MREIYLHGALSEKYGHIHTLDVNSAAEAVKALCILHKGFREDLSQGSYHVVNGPEDEGVLLTEETLRMVFPQSDLHIVPCIEGSGGGTGKAILGIALIATAFIGAPAVVGALGPTQGLGAAAFGVAGFTVSWANIATFGLSLALSGVSQALSPTPKAENLSAVNAEERPSFFVQWPGSEHRTGWNCSCMVWNQNTGWIQRN
jgi:predicted phage tail protein